MPWIQKIRSDGHLATELFQYIDDLRTTAHSKELAWNASSRIAKTCCWLGLPDVARKRREPSQRPGVWAGSSVHTSEENAFKGVTPDRWKKAQMKILWLAFQAGAKDEVTDRLMDEGKMREEQADVPQGQTWITRRLSPFEGSWCMSRDLTGPWCRI
jgi:hypothetical protein